MTLHWTHVRIPAPDRVGPGGISRPEPPAELSGLLRGLRAADPAARWFFHWSDGAHPAAVDLWAAARGDVSQEFARHCRELGPALGAPPENPPAPGEFHPAAVHGPAALPIEFDDEIAMASSELALAVTREPAFDHHTQLVLAVWQLRHVIALLGEPARRGFLFRIWQHRTAALTPAQRTGLCARSAEAVRSVAGGLPAMSPDTERGWEGYLRSLRRTAQAWQAADAPVNYLLFEHTHLTLRRLRVPSAVEALAARTLRASLTPSGADRAPLAVPRTVLQTA